MFKSATVLAILALVYSNSVHASPLARRGGNVCSSGIYGELAPILAPYAIAQAFCSDFYPVSCTPVIKEKRHTTQTTSCTDSTTKTSSKTSTPTTSVSTTKATTGTTVKTTSTTKADTDPKVSAWAKCQGQGPEVISILCSCIEVPKACATKNTTPTTTGTTKGSNPTTNTTPTVTDTGKNTSKGTASPTAPTGTTTTIGTMATTSTTSTTVTTATTASTSTSTSTSTTITTGTSASTGSSSGTSTSTSSSASAEPSTCLQLDPSGSGDYTAADGEVFYVECGYYREACHRNTLNGQVHPGSADGSNPPGKDGDYAESFRACLEECSTTPTCAYIQWEQDSNLCFLENTTDCIGAGPYAGYDRATLQTGASRLLF